MGVGGGEGRTVGVVAPQGSSAHHVMADVRMARAGVTFSDSADTLVFFRLIDPRHLILLP